MVDWQITATTIYCNAVDDDVTLMVYKDGSAKCAGYPKYGNPSKEIAKLLKKKGKQSRHSRRCGGRDLSRGSVLQAECISYLSARLKGEGG